MKFRIDKISKLYLQKDRCLCEGKERSDLHNMIFDINNWEINNYKSFLDSVAKTPQKYQGFMTPHPYEELVQPEWKTFKLRDYDAGFALHYTGKGKVDICNLHNNSNLRGISDLMLSFAKQQGGTTLDNYAGFLGDKYGKNGFDTYEEYEWDDQYRPDGWREDLFGTPNVEMRSLTAHDKKYNGKPGYRNKFDKKMNKSFPNNTISESKLVKIILESLNELHPETYASYANKRERQANGELPLSKAMKRKGVTSTDLKQKSKEGTGKATSEWNSRFSNNPKKQPNSTYFRMRNDGIYGLPYFSNFDGVGDIYSDFSQRYEHRYYPKAESRRMPDDEKTKELEGFGNYEDKREGQGWATALRMGDEYPEDFYNEKTGEYDTVRHRNSNTKRQKVVMYIAGMREERKEWLLKTIKYELQRRQDPIDLFEVKGNVISFVTNNKTNAKFIIYLAAVYYGVPYENCSITGI